MLEREQSALEGWISDERGEIRQHINAFVNGEQAQLLLVCRGRPGHRTSRRLLGHDRADGRIGTVDARHGDVTRVDLVRTAHNTPRSDCGTVAWDWRL